MAGATARPAPPCAASIARPSLRSHLFRVPRPHVAAADLSFPGSPRPRPPFPPSLPTCARTPTTCTGRVGPRVAYPPPARAKSRSLRGLGWEGPSRGWTPISDVTVTTLAEPKPCGSWGGPSCPCPGAAHRRASSRGPRRPGAPRAEPARLAPGLPGARRPSAATAAPGLPRPRPRAPALGAGRPAAEERPRGVPGAACGGSARRPPARRSRRPPAAAPLSARRTPGPGRPAPHRAARRREADAEGDSSRPPRQGGAAHPPGPAAPPRAPPAARPARSADADGGRRDGRTGDGRRGRQRSEDGPGSAPGPQQRPAVRAREARAPRVPGPARPRPAVRGPPAPPARATPRRAPPRGGRVTGPESPIASPNPTSLASQESEKQQAGPSQSQLRPPGLVAGMYLVTLGGQEVKASASPERKKVCAAASSVHVLPHFREGRAPAPFRMAHWSWVFATQWLRPSGLPQRRAQHSPKPPVAPKPKTSGLFTPATVPKSPASAQPEGLHSPSCMSRGPKPPIAPKPQLAGGLLNHSLAKCSNGGLLGGLGMPLGEHQAHIEGSGSETDEECAAVPGAALGEDAAEDGRGDGPGEEAPEDEGAREDPPPLAGEALGREGAESLEREAEEEADGGHGLGPGQQAPLSREEGQLQGDCVVDDLEGSQRGHTGTPLGPEELATSCEDALPSGTPKAASEEREGGWDHVTPGPSSEGGDGDRPTQDATRNVTEAGEGPPESELVPEALEVPAEEQGEEEGAAGGGDWVSQDEAPGYHEPADPGDLATARQEAEGHPDSEDPAGDDPAEDSCHIIPFETGSLEDLAPALAGGPFPLLPTESTSFCSRSCSASEAAAGVEPEQEPPAGAGVPGVPGVEMLDARQDTPEDTAAEEPAAPGAVSGTTLTATPGMGVGWARWEEDTAPRDVGDGPVSEDRNTAPGNWPLTAKSAGGVPETVLEETGPGAAPSSWDASTAPTAAGGPAPSPVAGHSLAFVLHPRSFSMETAEPEGPGPDGRRRKRTEDSLSLPGVVGSSGSFSQGSRPPGSGTSTPCSLVDIPPPFDLACVTKRPVTKSSPSLLAESEAPDRSAKKKKSSFKRFLELTFRKRTDSKAHGDTGPSSSRSSSESSYHGPLRLLEAERRSLGSSPRLRAGPGKPPAALLLPREGRRKGVPLSRTVSRVESFEDRCRPPFLPLPLTKPRSISFPNADTSDYENIPAMSSDYENVQLPPRWPARPGTFTKLFEEPSRALSLSPANESDGYVDMSSFGAFDSQRPGPEPEAESAYTEPYKICPVSVSAAPREDTPSEEEQASSEEEDGAPRDPGLAPKVEGQSRALLVAQELLSSERAYVQTLQLLCLTGRAPQCRQDHWSPQAQEAPTASPSPRSPPRVPRRVGPVSLSGAAGMAPRPVPTLAALLGGTVVRVPLGPCPEDFHAAVTQALGDLEQEGRDPRVTEELRGALRELPALLALHQGVLQELQQRLTGRDGPPKVAEVFLAHEQEFEHHAAHILQFDRCLSLLAAACQRSPRLAATVQDFEQASGRPVRQQLLQVVRRLFQYHVLLTDYLNNLCPDSAEYDTTQGALSLIAKVTDHAHESMEQGENLQQLVHIEHSVRGQGDLLQPGREFLKEGTLMRVKGKNRHPRHLFLMSDVLLYTCPQKDGTYRLKRSLLVAGMKVSRPVMEKVPCALRVETAETCLTLSASSCAERDEWYSSLSRALPGDHEGQALASFHHGVEIRERLGGSLGERPPTLVPVAHVMMCMNCGCDFSLTLRRHHCHACGKIVCRNCSRNKYPLKYLKDRMAKVCDGCHAELRRRAAASPAPGALRERPVSMSFPLSSARFSSGSAFSSVFQSISPSFKKQRRVPSALTEVAASGEGSAISGYLSRCKKGRRPWKRLWFVIKGKVLYTYMAGEDKVAVESLPLLGFTITPDEEAGSGHTGPVFHLYHKKTLFYSFKAEDASTAQRWAEAMQEASVL
ncbi:FYVE, RhoGEF and PH domain-containing protein 5 [Ctenodactylus gundi]